MYKSKSVRVEVCICDRCGRVMPIDDFEYQERISIDFRGGYASVFGDGNAVRGDFCQHCVKKLLGRWLRVTDSSTSTRHRARQPHQCASERPATLAQYLGHKP